MPKIEIREIDNTTPGVLDENFDVVYIPGFVNLSAVSASDVIKPRVPTLFTSLKSFTTKCGTAPARFESNQYYQDLNTTGGSFDNEAVPFTRVMFSKGDVDPSYVMAKELLAAGMNVIYERVNADSDISDVELTIGNDILTANSTYRVKIPVYRPISSAVPPVLFAHLANEEVVDEIEDTAEYFYCNEQLAGQSDDGTPYQDILEFDKTYTAISGEELKANAATYGAETVGSNVCFTTQSNVYVLANRFYRGLTTPATSKVPLVYDKDDNLIVEDVPGISATEITAYPSEWNLCYYRDYYELDEISVDAFFTGSDIEFVDADDLNVYLRQGLTSGTTVLSLLNGKHCSQIVESVTISKMYSALLDIFNTANTEGIVDRGNFNIKYLTSGGYPTFEYNGNTLVSKMLSLAEFRGDCVALIDHTDNSYRETNVDREGSVYQAVISKFDGTNGEFGAMFTPWCTFNRITSDVEPGPDAPVAKIRLGGSFAYLGALADSIKTNAPWLAVAGATRGKVQNLSANGLSVIIPNGAADFMQPRSSVERVGISVNAITDIKPYGNVIWGNRTLKKNDENLVATSFLNIRNLVSDVKKICYRTARKLTFEQNNDILWVNFKSMIAPTLDRMVSGYGISGYKFVRDTEHERAAEKATLCAKIFLYPVEPVEDFYITIMLEDDEVTVQ